MDHHKKNAKEDQDILNTLSQSLSKVNRKINNTDIFNELLMKKDISNVKGSPNSFSKEKDQIGSLSYPMKSPVRVSNPVEREKKFAFDSSQANRFKYTDKYQREISTNSPNRRRPERKGSLGPTETERHGLSSSNADISSFSSKDGDNPPLAPLSLRNPFQSESISFPSSSSTSLPHSPLPSKLTSASTSSERDYKNRSSWVNRFINHPIGSGSVSFSPPSMNQQTPSRSDLSPESSFSLEFQKKSKSGAALHNALSFLDNISEEDALCRDKYAKSGSSTPSSRMNKKGRFSISLEDSHKPKSDVDSPRGSPSRSSSVKRMRTRSERENTASTNKYKSDNTGDFNSTNQIDYDSDDLEDLMNMDFEPSRLKQTMTHHYNDSFHCDDSKDFRRQSSKGDIKPDRFYSKGNAANSPYLTSTSNPSPLLSRKILALFIGEKLIYDRSISNDDFIQSLFGELHSSIEKPVLGCYLYVYREFVHVIFKLRYQVKLDSCANEPVESNVCTVLDDVEDKSSFVTENDNKMNAVASLPVSPHSRSIHSQMFHICINSFDISSAIFSMDAQDTLLWLSLIRFDDNLEKIGMTSLTKDKLLLYLNSEGMTKSNLRVTLNSLEPTPYIDERSTNDIKDGILRATQQKSSGNYKTNSPYFKEYNTRSKSRGYYNPIKSSVDYSLEPYSLDTLVTSDFTELFSYPFKEGKRPVITIRAEEISRLEEGQYLNDILIDFYLRYIMDTTFETLKDSVYIFNSYFYKMLTSERGSADQNYSKVKKWTNTVNLFSKDYIFIPIHESLHWFLTLIVHPKMCLVTESTENEKMMNEGNVEDEEQQSSSSQIFKSSFDEDHSQESNLTDPKTYIFIFDSLGSRKKIRTIQEIKTYISMEAQAKLDKRVDLKKIVGVHVKAPTQRNSVDCGVFVLHYTEKFLKNVHSLIPLIVARENIWQWFPISEIPEKRLYMKELLKTLTAEYKLSQHSVQPKKEDDG